MAAILGAFGLVLTAGTFDVPKAASVVSAAPAVAPDPTAIPHYFGPYPNWANSPQVLADAVVTLSAPPDGVGNETAEATATVIPKTGSIGDITVTKPGSGYVTPPTVTITSPGVTPTVLATATAEISQGVVSAVDVLEPGFGFTTPAVEISGGGTPTAVATAQPSGGVDDVTITDGGVYEVQPIVKFGIPDVPGGTQATATATMVPLDPNAPTPTYTVSEITIVDPGSGYTTAPSVTIFDGSLTQTAPTPAVVTSTINIGAIAITNGGAGYSSAPVVAITDAANPDPVNPDKGASAAAVIAAGGAVTAITVTNAGAGYLTPGLRKFVDTLSGLGAQAANDLGNFIPVGVPDTTTYPGTDYYEIGLVQYRHQFHKDLPATLMRGYVQLSTAVVPGNHRALTNANLDPALPASPALLPDGTQAYGVDTPHYLGPTIVATKDRPVRILFRNLLPTGEGGDLFLPVDTSLMGAGMGPNGVMLDSNGVPMDMVADEGTVYDGVRNPECGRTPKPTTCYTENRATLHLHGGITPWISDGTPHQWITPANELTDYPEGVSVSNVPDMPDPGPGAQTFFYTNQQSARLMFYHDHAWGITRLNVYAGEAAGYLLTDATEQSLFGPGKPFADLGLGTPLVVQDKTFVPDKATMDKLDPTWNYAKWGGEGNLWTPHVYMPAQNPGDPSGMSAFGRWMYGPWFWPPAKDAKYPPIDNPYYDPTCNPDVQAFCEPPLIPSTPNVSVGMEAFNDTPIVNGTAYPTTTVDPKAYRYRILNAANDRFWNLSWYVADPRTGTLSEVALNPTELAAAQTDPVVTPTPDTTWSPKGPNWIQIGTEGGFLPAPVVVPAQPTTWITDPTRFDVGNVDQHSLLLAPAERADVIVDFSQFRGKTLILYNDAPAAFPARVPGYDYYTGGPDMSPAGAPTTLPGYGPNTRTIMQVKVSTKAPTIAFDRPNTTLDRMGTLTAAFAHHADGSGVFESGSDPIIVGQAAYNSAYGSDFVGSGWCNSPSKPTARCDGYARIAEGSQPTDLFKFDTLGTSPADASIPKPQLSIPFQPKGMHDEMNSANFDEWGRMTANLGLEAPGATPLLQNIILYPYVNPPTETLNSTGLPSSLDVTPIASADDGTQIWKITHNGVDTHPIHFHLYDVQVINRVTWDNIIIPPEPTELGWKDTVRISPLEDTIVAVRPIVPTLPFAVPDSVRPLNPMMPVGARGAANGPNGLEAGFNNTDARGNPIAPIVNQLTNFHWEYVFHCHILSHEEMDMMRPVTVRADWTAPPPPTGLTFTRGSVILDWNDPTPVDYADPSTWMNPLPGAGGSNPEAEIGFHVWRAPADGADAGVFENIADVPANTTRYIDTTATLDPTRTYLYTVTSWNEVGESPQSAPVTAPGLGATTTVVTSSPNPSVFGQNVTFSMAVTSATAGVPGGSIELRDGAATLATAALAADGTATFSTAALTVGTHPITAMYSGDAVFAPSSASLPTQVVDQASTQTIVTSSVNPSKSGESVTFTADVSAVAPASGVPAGTVQFFDGPTSLAPPAPLTAGTATVSTATLAVGHHSITAVYSGSTSFAPSTSTAVDQVVDLGTTVTVVSSDRTPSSVFGTLVTFTANVTVTPPASGTPTGTVEFFDGLTSLGAAVPITAGVATLSTGALAVGSHPIAAVYSGDASFTTSTGNRTQVVVPGTTATALTSDVNPSLYGGAVTFTAKVSTITGIGNPTGTVQFFDGPASLGSATLSAGTASMSTAALTGGTHTITAVYNGDASFTGSLSPAVAQVVTPGTTSITIAGDPNPSVYGNPVSFTATIAVVTGAGTPTGSVSFFDGVTTLGTSPLVGGTATLSTAALGGGSHTVAAFYSGDGNFVGVNGTTTQVVQPGTTATTVTSSANPSVQPNAVTFTASVAAVTGVGARTGTIVFRDGANVLGSGTLVAGAAAFTTPALAFGIHTITAQYGGDANFTGSTSAALTQTVLRASTTTLTSSRPIGSTFGQAVTFIATVREVVTNVSAVGAVQFNIDGVDVGGLRALNGAGRATFSTNTLTAGDHTVTATYGGDAATFFATSTSPTITQHVNQGASTTTLSSSINPSPLGQSVTITARVSPVAATGTVLFAVDNVPWIGGPQALNATGRASIVLNSLGAGSHTITAAYSGSPDYLASSATMTQTVKWLTATTVISSRNPSPSGTSVTFTATVRTLAPGTTIPTGTVQFRAGGANVGLPVALDATGRATFTTSALPVGTTTVSARYAGDATHWNSTSNNLSQTIQ